MATERSLVRIERAREVSGQDDRAKRVYLSISAPSVQGRGLRRLGVLLKLLEAVERKVGRNTRIWQARKKALRGERLRGTVGRSVLISLRNERQGEYCNQRGKKRDDQQLYTTFY
jgi:hypothetical protein